MPRWLLLLLAACQLVSARTWVVAAGVEQYDDQGITPLRYAVADVSAVAKTFADSGVPASQISLLRSDSTDYRQRPTAANIIAALRQVREQATGDDSLIFLFSGHGIEQDGQAFLLTVDTQRDLMHRTALAMADITATLQGYQGRRVLLVIDACRNDPEAGKGEADAELDESFAKGLRPKLNPTVAAPAPDIALLLACDVGQRAWEMPSENHGAFTYWLLKGLQGGAAGPDGTVKLAALSDYVSREVAAWAERARRVQTPRLDYAGEDFVIATPNAETTLILMAGATSSHSGFNGQELREVTPAHPEIHRGLAPGAYKYQTFYQGALFESHVTLQPGETKIVTLSRWPKDGRPRVLVDLGADRGLVLELRPDQAPNAVAKFVAAVKAGYYDGLAFHRVVQDFVAQIGDSSTREGNPTPYVGWDLPVERNSLKHVRGTLALTGATGGGVGPQFYIMYGENKQLDGTDTVFGQVLSDCPDDPLLKAIKQGDRILSMRLLPTE